MKRTVFARCIAPGFNETETVTDHIDTLLDFAQFYEYPDFHLLAQECHAIEQEHGNRLCRNLKVELQEFFLDLQDKIIAYAVDRIHNEETFVKRAQFLEQMIREHPADARSQERALALDLVNDQFENMFHEEAANFCWHARLVANIVWHFDNWFGDRIAAIYSFFMTDMIEEVYFWKMAREVSVARAFG